MPHLNLKQREKAIALIDEDGLSYSAVARRMRTHKTTIARIYRNGVVKKPRKKKPAQQRRKRAFLELAHSMRKEALKKDKTIGGSQISLGAIYGRFKGKGGVSMKTCRRWLKEDGFQVRHFYN